MIYLQTLILAWSFLTNRTRVQSCFVCITIHSHLLVVFFCNSINQRDGRKLKTCTFSASFVDEG
jgi:hypothetical protein